MNIQDKFSWTEEKKRTVFHFNIPDIMYKDVKG